MGSQYSHLVAMYSGTLYPECTVTCKQCTLYTVHCTHCIQCTQCTVSWQEFTAICKQYTHCTIYNMICTLCSQLPENQKDDGDYCIENIDKSNCQLIAFFPHWKWTRNQARSEQSNQVMINKFRSIDNIKFLHIIPLYWNNEG